MIIAGYDTTCYNITCSWHAHGSDALGSDALISNRIFMCFSTVRGHDLEVHVGREGEIHKLCLMQ